MTLETGLAVVACVVLGSASQRITGMGFALVVSPFLVVLLGTGEGVLAVNALGACSAALVIPQVWRKMEKTVIVPLAVGALAGAAMGVITVRVLNPVALSLAVAFLMVIVLVLVGVVRRPVNQNVGVRAVLLVGVISGSLTSAAGVGGPPLVFLARAQGWGAERFAATIQPVAIVVAIASVAGKLVTGGAAIPIAPGWLWVSLPLAMLLGVSIGGLLAPLLRAAVVWAAVYAIACVGAVLATASAIIAVLHG